MTMETLFFSSHVCEAYLINSIKINKFNDVKLFVKHIL